MKFADVAWRVVCVLRIQRFVRRIKPLEDTCPVSLEPLRPPIFRFYSRRGARPIGYNLRAILDNIKVSGKLVDPKTRKKYKDTDIERIHALLQAYDGKGFSMDESPLVARQRRIDELTATAVQMVRNATHPSPDSLRSFFQLWIMSEFYPVYTIVRELAGIDRFTALDVAWRLAQMSTLNSDQALFEGFHTHIDTVFADDIAACMRGLFVSVLEDEGPNVN